jgi:hypothetical protein
MKECFNLLKKYKHKLTRQQLQTLKGQIKANDIAGFKKGLYNIVFKRGI